MWRRDRASTVASILGAGVFVACGTTVLAGLDGSVLVGLGIEMGWEVFSSFSLASTVASILGAGFTGEGPSLEQASTRVPINTAKTTVSFIYLPLGCTNSQLLLLPSGLDVPCFLVFL